MFEQPLSDLHMAEIESRMKVCCGLDLEHATDPPTCDDWECVDVLVLLAEIRRLRAS